MDRAFDNLARKAEQANSLENAYLATDGLYHCAVCNGALEVVVETPWYGERKVRCACKCAGEERRKWEAWKRAEHREDRRRDCFRGTNMSGWNFANDDGRNPDITDVMRKYAERFPEYWRSGKGLLLYGTVGTGKTFYSACVANAVIDAGYRAYMTNFATIADDLSGTWDKAEYIDSLMRYDLLIIDDLGAERKSEFMQEQVWKVSDARYRSGLPLIVTTNLTAEELDAGDGLGNKRIYSRLLERCLAVEVKGKDRRREIARRDWATMRAELGIGGT